MPWEIVYVGLAVAGLSVLGVAGFRLLLEVRALGHAVADASQRLAEAASELEAASQPRPDRGRRSIR